MKESGVQNEGGVELDGRVRNISRGARALHRKASCTPVSKMCLEAVQNGLEARKVESGKNLETGCSACVHIVQNVV